MKYHGEVIVGGFRQGRALLRAVQLLMSVVCVCGQGHLAWAQARSTATPVVAVIITPTAEGEDPPTPTSTATLSPTPLPAVRLRARSTAGNINVRALPNLESAVLGIIVDATEYQVLRNYFRWYEFRYDASPNGRAWVYGDLVEIIGDRSLIEVIDNAAEIERPGQAEDLLAGGGEGDSQRTIAISTVQAGADQSVELAVATVLPTFTRPPPTPASINDQVQIEAGIQNSLLQVPPILPIAVLGGLGLLGLLISAIRP
ncbi:MAG: hypothetical protein F4X02_05840 [Chloroflexi bacterium]|nr:hypothetical protein [Chloroflexota bacterium]